LAYPLKSSKCTALLPRANRNTIARIQGVQKPKRKTVKFETNALPVVRLPGSKWM